MTDHEVLKRNTLIAATAASFLTPFMGSSINMAIPAIGKEFNAGAFHLGWVVTGYLLASAAFLLPFGKAADIIGRKKVFLSGIICFSMFSLLCGFSHTIEVLIILRVLQGISSSMIFGTAIAILTSVFPGSERGRVLGINTAAVYVGLSLGPVLGGALNHHFGWQSIFFANFAMGLVTLLFVRKLEEEWVGSPGEKFDFLGSFLYAVGLVSLMFGISSITNSDWAKMFVVAGIIILSMFVVLETRKEFPLFNFKLLMANATFTFSNLAALINYSATFAVGFLVSIYLQSVLNYNSQSAGVILLAQPVVMAALSPIAGRLSDQMPPYKIASFGIAVTVIALIAFSQIKVGTSLYFLVFFLLLFGAGLALFSSPNTNAAMGAVDRVHYGVASSTLGTMRLVGQAVSMAVVTLVMTAYIGNTELAQVPVTLLTESIKTLFMIFAVLSFLGIFASLKRNRTVSPEVLERRN